MNQYFDWHKWQYKTGHSAKEIDCIFDEYGVKGKKIVKVNAIGLAENLEPWRYENEVNRAAMDAGIPREMVFNGEYPYMDDICGFMSAISAR